MSDFTHLDESNRPIMVDVTNKSVTKRTAIAQSIISVDDSILTHFNQDDISTKKGSVFQTAIIAGIMGVKRTSDLIPLCHPLAINSCNIDIKLNDQKDIAITCKVVIEGKTGVEMEALTGASIAALTVYDMCKGISQNMVIKETKLLKKTGGKSDIERS